MINDFLHLCDNKSKFVNVWFKMSLWLSFVLYTYIINNVSFEKKQMIIKFSIFSITRHNLLVTRTPWGKRTTNRHALGILSMLTNTAQIYFSFMTDDLITINKYYNIKYYFIFYFKEQPKYACIYKPMVYLAVLASVVIQWKIIVHT